MITSLDIAFNQTLRQRSLKVLEQITDIIIGGGCADYSSYRHQVGVCEGIKRVLDEAEDLRKQLTGAQ